MPWNTRARSRGPRTPQQLSRRRRVLQFLLAAAATAIVFVAVLTVTGETSGPVRIFGLAVLVLAGLAVVGLVGTVLNTVGWPNQSRRR